MARIKEPIGEKIKELKDQKRVIQTKIKELEPKAIKKCSFCQKELKTDKNNYLKNRYKLTFWNNNPNEKRLICYTCLKYSYNRNLPLISESKFKRQIFKKYEKKGMFKEI